MDQIVGFYLETQEFRKARQATKAEYDRANKARSTRKANKGSGWDRVESLARREGWTCALCGKPIDPKARGRQGATVDHIIPLSLGGKGGLKNCQLAHSYCNNKRGNKPLD